MWVLLALVAAAVAFGIGWRVGRRATAPSEHAAEALQAAVVGTDVVEHHPIGVMVTDRDGVVVYRNAIARGLIGTHRGLLVDDAVERRIVAARGGHDDAELIELYGPPRTVLVVAAHRLRDGMVAVYVEDISERHRIDQIRTDFVTNISHELKTPIGALSLLAETLLDETDPITSRRIAERMTGEADRAARTIDDLLELSRIEADGERVAEPIAVDGVIDDAVARVVELASGRGITMTINRSAEPGALVVAGDRRQLTSAVGNLVENAVKYSDDGSEIEIDARLAGDDVEILVTDHGSGIPQADLDRVFERFYRVDRARSRSTGGTGLGLSIVRHVATNHGGEVAVTSREGEGSTFVLRIPAFPAATGEPAHDSADDERASRVG